MASRTSMGVALLFLVFVALVRSDAEADAEADADPEADPAGCCSRPMTFVKGSFYRNTFSNSLAINFRG